MPVDPAGIFPSDEHRRVLANCSGRTLEQIASAVHGDAYTQLWPKGPGDYSDVQAILDDLTADGHLKKPDKDGRFEFSKSGLDALTGPAANEPPAMEPERAAREVADFVARERAGLDQQHAESLARIDAEADDAKAALKANVKSYRDVLDGLEGGQ